jgi:hypothetical protein
MKKHLGKLLPAAIAAVAAALMVAPGAMAATPAPGYTQFTGCPSQAEAPWVEICIHSTIKGGHFQMGTKDVPINKPIDMTGGTDANFENFAANAQGGLKQVKLKVPGGVIGLTGLTWLAELLGSEALTLYAVTEAVGQPKLNPERIQLPARIHLINSVLGNNCFVGSPSNPIMLDMITGTTSPPLPNKPIKGKDPVAEFLPGGILALKGGEYVDNKFSAPGASGCTLTLFGFIPISINGLVNSQSGLPSAAGKNETRQLIDTEAAEETVVYP